jgi:hypothetical protein
MKYAYLVSTQQNIEALNKKRNIQISRLKTKLLKKKKNIEGEKKAEANKKQAEANKIQDEANKKKFRQKLENFKSKKPVQLNNLAKFNEFETYPKLNSKNMSNILSIKKSKYHTVYVNLKNEFKKKYNEYKETNDNIQSHVDELEEKIQKINDIYNKYIKMFDAGTKKNNFTSTHSDFITEATNNIRVLKAKIVKTRKNNNSSEINKKIKELKSLHIKKEDLSSKRELFTKLHTSINAYIDKIDSELYTIEEKLVSDYSKINSNYNNSNISFETKYDEIQINDNSIRIEINKELKTEYDAIIENIEEIKSKMNIVEKIKGVKATKLQSMIRRFINRKRFKKISPEEKEKILAQAEEKRLEREEEKRLEQILQNANEANRLKAEENRLKAQRLQAEKNILEAQRLQAEKNILEAQRLQAEKNILEAQRKASEAQRKASEALRLKAEENNDPLLLSIAGLKTERNAKAKENRLQSQRLAQRLAQTEENNNPLLRTIAGL